MKIKKLVLINRQDSRILAYLYPGEDAWRDPHGGEFTSAEQWHMTEAAEGRGHSEALCLGAGTKFERVVMVRFAVEFE